MDIRDKIIHDSGILFIQNGIRQITMDTIANTMGISKRTIYENFKDKNDLLTNILTNGILDQKKKAIEIINKADNVIDALFSFGDFHKDLMTNINPLFFSDLKKFHPQVFENILSSGQVRNFELTYTVLKRGLNDGTFRKEIDLDVANLFMHHIMDFFQKYENHEKCNHKAIFLSVHLPYLRGISTEKGNDLLKKTIKKYENSDNK